MKLIIEHSSSRIYAYFESNRHHKKVNSHRYAKQEISATELEKECDLSTALPAGTFMVIPVKRKKLNSKRKCRGRR